MRRWRYRYEEIGDAMYAVYVRRTNTFLGTVTQGRFGWRGTTPTGLEVSFFLSRVSAAAWLEAQWERQAQEAR